MTELQCKMCGGDLVAQGDMWACQSCGRQYAMDKPAVSVAPAAPKAESTIALNDDVERLLEKCRSDPYHARRYANLVLDIDPTNREVLKYL